MQTKLENFDIVNFNNAGPNAGSFYQLKYDVTYPGTSYKPARGNRGYTICVSPFHNCQIYTIGAFQSLLGNENVVDILQKIQSSVNKTELLIDVKTTCIEQIEKLFNKDEIIFKTLYTNNTKSQMVMYLLQISQMLSRVKRETQAKSSSTPNPAVNTVQTNIRAAASRRVIQRDSNGRFARRVQS